MPFSLISRGPSTSQSISCRSSTPPILFHANSTRRASVCSPPRSPAPTLSVPPDPKARLEVGVFTVPLPPVWIQVAEVESSRDGGDDLGILWEPKGKVRAAE
ncbi:hypothetical protein Q3G72_005320 [Acer saccharum]|nr:hypothetical protein Q3G72_005320 [Acer saccharum]